MNNTRARVRSFQRNVSLVNWAQHNRFMLLLTGAIVSLLWILGVVWIERDKTTVIVFLLSAGWLIAGSCLIAALARIVELLKAIRRELVMISMNEGLLDTIATDLTAMRAQMGRGVLGLLGM